MILKQNIFKQTFAMATASIFSSLVYFIYERLQAINCVHGTSLFARKYSNNERKDFCLTLLIRDENVRKQIDSLRKRVKEQDNVREKV